MIKILNKNRLFLIFIIILLFLGIPSYKLYNKQIDTDITTVYLRSNNLALIPENELSLYPQIKVVDNFSQVVEFADKKYISIWIDKDLASLSDKKWLKEKDMKTYPIAIIGYSDAVYSFKELLPIYELENSNVDLNKDNLKLGFSIGFLHKISPDINQVFIKGYSKQPTAKDILTLTDMLQLNKIP